MAPPQSIGPALVKGQFIVTFAGLGLSAFVYKGKIPGAKPKKTELKPGGSTVPTKFPNGMAEYDNAEFELYQSADGAVERDLDTWRRQCFDVRTGKASVPPAQARREVTVEQVDADGRLVHEWKLKNAFPVEFGDIELEGQSEDAVSRKLVLSVDWVDKIQ